MSMQIVPFRVNTSLIIGTGAEKKKRIVCFLSKLSKYFLFEHHLVKNYEKDVYFANMMGFGSVVVTLSRTHSFERALLEHNVTSLVSASGLGPRLIEMFVHGQHYSGTYTLVSVAEKYDCNLSEVVKNADARELRAILRRVRMILLVLALRHDVFFTDVKPANFVMKRGDITSIRAVDFNDWCYIGPDCLGMSMADYIGCMTAQFVIVARITDMYSELDNALLRTAVRNDKLPTREYLKMRNYILPADSSEIRRLQDRA